MLRNTEIIMCHLILYKGLMRIFNFPLQECWLCHLVFWVILPLAAPRTRHARISLSHEHDLLLNQFSVIFAPEMDVSLYSFTYVGLSIVARQRSRLCTRLLQNGARLITRLNSLTWGWLLHVAYDETTPLRLGIIVTSSHSRDNRFKRIVNIFAIVC